MYLIRSATVALWVVSLAGTAQQTTPAQPAIPATNGAATPTVTPGSPATPTAPGTLPETQTPGTVPGSATIVPSPATSKDRQHQLQMNERAGQAQPRLDKARRKALKQQQRAAKAQAKPAPVSPPQ